MNTKTEALSPFELAVAYEEFTHEMWMRTAEVYGAFDEHTVRAFKAYDAERINAELEETYEIADAIEGVFETRPVGYWWTISAVARKGRLDPAKTGRVLRWMAENRYAITNGRGGCWVNYGRTH